MIVAVLSSEHHDQPHSEPCSQQDQGSKQEDDLVRLVLGFGLATVGLLQPPELGLNQQHEAEEEAGDEPADVREVVHVGQYPDGQVDGGDDDQVQHGCKSVRVDAPIGDELRQHRSQEAEERAGGAHGDALPDEEDGEHAPAESRHQVHEPHLPESKLLLEADADEDEADHVGEQVDEAGVQPGAGLQPPALVPVHDLVPVEGSVLLQRGGGGPEEGVLLERLEGEAVEEAAADAVAAAARAVVVEHDHHEHGHVGDHHQRHQPGPVVPLVRRRVVVVERRGRHVRRAVGGAGPVVPPRRRLDPRRRRRRPRRAARLHVGVRHRLT